VRRIGSWHGPDVGGKGKFDRDERRAVTGQIHPREIVIGEIVGDALGFTGRIGDGPDLPLRCGTFVAHGYQECVSAGKPMRATQITVSRVKSASGAVGERKFN